MNGKARRKKGRISNFLEIGKVKLHLTDSRPDGHHPVFRTLVLVVCFSCV